VATDDDRWYCLEITAGDAEGAGADGTVGVWVCDRNGIRTVEQVLACAFFDDVGRGRTGCHFVRTPPQFTEPTEIVLRLRTAHSWLAHEVRMVGRNSDTATARTPCGCMRQAGTTATTTDPGCSRRSSAGPEDVWLTDVNDSGSRLRVLALKPVEAAPERNDQAEPPLGHNVRV
jgi:hypothetical protein